MLLELKNIYKSFGQKQVLKGVSFTAESGRAFGLLGRNGAGKTTTIRILMNVFTSDGGDVLIDGKPVDYHKVSFGYLPEERGLYAKRTIKEQLVYFAELKGMSRRKASESVGYWLDRLGMSDQAGRKLETLSKGNQQKIQLITALAHDPGIIVLDEPFSGLDPVNAGVLKEIVKEQIARGKLVIFSSHQMNYVEEFCDQIAILHGGEIAVSGDLYQIKRGYARDKLVVRSKNIDVIQLLFKNSCEVRGRHEALISVPAHQQKQEVMGRLVAQFDIDEIRVYEPSLSDIFIQYTGNGGEGGQEENESI